MVFRIIYMSTTARAPAAEELEALMRVARANNERDGITGLVAYHDFTFIQVLEGPREKVEACFERIRQNPLHHNVILVWTDDAAERCFQDYSMAFVPVDRDAHPQSETFKDLRALYRDGRSEEVIPDQIVAGFFDAFREVLRR